MVTVYYNPSYAAAAYAFPTTRKARWIAESLQAKPIPGIALENPQPLTEDDLRTTHDPQYIRAVRTGEPRTLAQSQGLGWDPGLWPMVLASNGGTVAAALRALRDGLAGSLSSGLHHAPRAGCRLLYFQRPCSGRPGRFGCWGGRRVNPGPGCPLRRGHAHTHRREPAHLAGGRVGRYIRPLRAWRANDAGHCCQRRGLLTDRRPAPPRYAGAAVGAVHLSCWHGSARRLF